MNNFSFNFLNDSNIDNNMYIYVKSFLLFNTKPKI